MMQILYYIIVFDIMYRHCWDVWKGSPMRSPPVWLLSRENRELCGKFLFFRFEQTIWSGPGSRDLGLCKIRIWNAYLGYCNNDIFNCVMVRLWGHSGLLQRSNKMTRIDQSREAGKIKPLFVQTVYCGL